MSMSLSIRLSGQYWSQNAACRASIKTTRAMKKMLKGGDRGHHGTCFRPSNI